MKKSMVGFYQLWRNFKGTILKTNAYTNLNFNAVNLSQTSGVSPFLPLEFLRMMNHSHRGHHIFKILLCSEFWEFLKDVLNHKKASWQFGGVRRCHVLLPFVLVRGVFSILFSERKPDCQREKLTNKTLW